MRAIFFLNSMSGNLESRLSSSSDRYGYILELIAEARQNEELMKNARVKTLEEYVQYKQANQEERERIYSGLHVHIMEHISEHGIYDTVAELEKVAFGLELDRKISIGFQDVQAA